MFSEFITELVATQGVEAPGRNMPSPVAGAAAAACEGIWRALRLKGTPPVTRLAVWLSSQECTIDISRARSELGYEPMKTRKEGMAELRTAHVTGATAARAQPSAS